jgi:SAM-dependent methyltransferase
MQADVHVVALERSICAPPALPRAPSASASRGSSRIELRERGARASPVRAPYDPALYDLVHTGTPGDVAFYVRMVAGAERVLELGCGSGRVLVAMAEAGCDVTGLELDEGMLEGARARVAGLAPEARARVTLVQGDMSDFTLDARFDRVVVPFSGLYCLSSPSRAASCLRCVRAHLAPGGLFVFDGYAADEFHARSRPEDYPDDRLEPVAEIVHEGEALTVLEKSTWDRARQRVDATYVYRTRGGRVRHRATIAHRYLRRREIEPLLDAAGLALVSIYGDFEGSPYDPAQGSLVVVARR